MRVLAARGGEFEGEFAYGIVRQLFEPPLVSAAPELRAELLSGPAALVEPLFRASQLAESQDLPAEGSFAILHGLYWLAANVAFHPADAACDRRPALGGHPVAAVARAPDTKARGCLFSSPRRRGRRRRATIPRSSQSSSPIQRSQGFTTPWACLDRGARPSAARSGAGRGFLRRPRNGHRKPALRGRGAGRVCAGGNQPDRRARARLLEIGAGAFLAPSRFVSLACRRMRLPSSARPRSSATRPSCATRPRSPAWKQANLVRPLTHSFGSTSSGGRIRSSSSTRSSAAPSTRRSMWSNETPRIARPLSCCWRPARRRRVRRHLLRVAPQADAFVVSTLRRAAERSLAEGAADAAVGYLSRALDEQIDPAAGRRCWSSSALRSGGRAARLRPTTCGPVSSHLADPARRRSRARARPRALVHEPEQMLLQSSSGRLTRSIGSATRTSTSCSWRS